MLGLLTAQEVALGSGGQITAEDPRVQPLIDGATTAVRRYCGWHIAPELTDTITLDGPGGRFLRLPTLHCASVDELLFDGDLVPARDYSVSRLGLIELHGREFPRRYGAVTVTFTHGFATAPDVAQVVRQVVGNAFASPLGLTREQAGQVSVSWSQTAPGVSGGISLLARDLAILDQYKLEGA